MKVFNIILLLGILVSPALATAQFSLPGSGASIELNPIFPKPGDVVSVSLNAYTYDTTGSTIIWKINDTELTNLQNKRQFTTVAPEIGEKVKIEAFLRLRDGQIVPAAASFTVSDVDLVIDADTLVPSFYKGRPLPSIGSTIQVVAIPKTGQTASPENYSYTWRFNNEVIEGGSIKGGYVGRFQMPIGRSATLQVDVSDEAGTVIAQKRIAIPNHEPELYFYQDNPLRGLSRVVVPNNFILQSGEATFRAEPYFMDKNILSQSPHLEWKVNGRTLTNPADDKQNITLQNSGGTGTFSIEFHLRNLAQLLQGVRGSFNLSF